jgi:hypothetical protein
LPHFFGASIFIFLNNAHKQHITYKVIFNWHAQKNGTILASYAIPFKYKIMTNFLCLAVIAVILCWSMGAFSSIGKAKQQESD